MKLSYFLKHLRVNKSYKTVLFHLAASRQSFELSLDLGQLLPGVSSDFPRSLSWVTVLSSWKRFEKTTKIGRYRGNLIPKQALVGKSADFGLSLVLTWCENRTLDGATSPWMSK